MKNQRSEVPQISPGTVRSPFWVLLPVIGVLRVAKGIVDHLIPDYRILADGTTVYAGSPWEPLLSLAIHFLFGAALFYLVLLGFVRLWKNSGTWVGKWMVRGTLAVVVGVPLLGLGSCAYMGWSPHLLAGPLTKALYEAPQHPELVWRSQDVVLTPGVFELSASFENVEERLKRSGFKLFLDVEERLSAGSDDWRRRHYQEAYLDRGITHEYHRGGRIQGFWCGESFFVELGFERDRLRRATGYRRWTCL